MVEDLAPVVATYRAALKALTDVVAVPGTSLSGRTEQVFHWPRLRVSDSTERRLVLDDDYIEG